MPTREKPATIQIVLSTMVPLIMGICATWVTLVITERYGWDIAPFVLVGWRIALSLSAVWLNWAIFRRARTLLPFMAAAFVILLVWLWQKEAFTILVPHSGLTYGFFLRPEGAKAGFWTLTLPFRAGLAALALCLIAGLVSTWRAGYRGLLACIIPWWLTAFLIFSLPSMYLDAQGNASVSI